MVGPEREREREREYENGKFLSLEVNEKKREKKFELLLRSQHAPPCLSASRVSQKQVLNLPDFKFSPTEK